MTNTEAVYVYFLLKKQNFFQCVQQSLEIFYQSLYFAVVCWGSSTGDGDTNRLDKTILKAGSVTLTLLSCGEEEVTGQTGIYHG